MALVIGNSAYKNSPLANPVNDAKDMAATLRRLGFDVIEKTNASQKDMNLAIVHFGEKLRADTVALFFYAGHGMQVKGKNYVIPVDAQINSEATVRAMAVDVDTVMDQLAVSPMNIVILDACRNNPFERRFRSTSGGLAQMDAPKGSLIAYATAPGKVAADGESRNGLYTQELLKHIQTPGLPLEAVFKRVRNGVMAASGEAQTPWESSSLTGDFYFVGTGAKPASDPPSIGTAQPPADTTNAAIELAFWDSIKGSKSAEDFNAYLQQYPNGNFAALARNRMAEMSAPKSPSPPPKDSPDGVWQGRLETYGGLFEQPVNLGVKLRVAGGRIDGEVFMYGENRKFTGEVDSSGKLSNAKLTGSLQSYDLSGTLNLAHGEGMMGWKLRMNLKREE